MIVMALSYINSRQDYGEMLICFLKSGYKVVLLKQDSTEDRTQKVDLDEDVFWSCVGMFLHLGPSLLNRKINLQNEDF